MRYVLLDRWPLVVIQTAVDGSAFAHEVGGVLLGAYRSDCLHIVQATPPQGGDRWSPVRFWRSPLGHQEIAHEVWRRSERTVTYVGDWHSHAELRPLPSVIDRASWRSAVKAQGRPLVFLIQGMAGVCLALADADRPLAILVRLEEDERSILFGPRP